MNKNRWMTSIALGVLFGVTVIALGQSHRPTGKSIGMTPAPVTPELRARLDETNRLDAAAAAALDAGRYAEAEMDAKQSMSVGHDSGLAEETLAAALDAQGKTQEALKVYQAMYNTGDTFARNELPYALLLLKTGQWEKAVEAYNRQLPYSDELLRANSHLSPDVPQPRELTTAIYIGLGLTHSAATWGGHMQTDKSLSEFRQAITLEPDSALAHLYYGRALQQVGRKAEAQAALQKAASLDEGDIRAAAEREMKR